MVARIRRHPRRSLIVLGLVALLGAALLVYAGEVDFTVSYELTGSSGDIDLTKVYDKAGETPEELLDIFPVGGEIALTSDVGVTLSLAEGEEAPGELEDVYVWGVAELALSSLAGVTGPLTLTLQSEMDGEATYLLKGAEVSITEGVVSVFDGPIRYRAESLHIDTRAGLWMAAPAGSYDGSVSIELIEVTLDIDPEDGPPNGGGPPGPEDYAGGSITFFNEENQEVTEAPHGTRIKVLLHASYGRLGGPTDTIWAMMDLDGVEYEDQGMGEVTITQYFTAENTNPWPVNKDVEGGAKNLTQAPDMFTWIIETLIILPGGAPNEPPVASASATPTVAAIDQDVQFSSEGSSDPEGGALTFLWDFGDNSTSTDAGPTHSYDSGGSYTVTLTVTDPEDAEGTDTVTVTAVEVSFDTNPVMVGVSKTETVTATVTPSDAYGDVSFSTADATIATVSPATASSNEEELTVSGIKTGTTTLQAEVGEYSCGSAAISVGQMVVLRITPNHAYFVPGEQVIYTAVAFAGVQGCRFIPKDYSPDLSTPIGTEVTVDDAKGIYLGPTPATWGLNATPDFFIPEGVVTEGVSSVVVEAALDAEGDMSPRLHARGCVADDAGGATVKVEIVPATLQPALLQKVQYIFDYPECVKPIRHTVEIRWKEEDAEWYAAVGGPSKLQYFKHRAAGYIQVRAKVLLNDGTRVYSKPVDMEIRFPHHRAISNDQTVKNAMDDAWQRTMQASTPTRYQEFGFWIYYNTAEEKFIIGPLKPGEPVTPGTRASVNLGAPSDSLRPWLPTGSVAGYYVASFHTHVSMEYSTWRFRLVGRSGTDLANANRRKVPGFVYDYTAVQNGRIPAQHPTGSPAQVYWYGPERRETPK